MTHTSLYFSQVIEELNKTANSIPDEASEALLNQMMKSGKIFVAGAGRSGLMGKAFVMRMMHMGLDAYVVGETVTANLEKGDLLIIGTDSGETKTLIPIAEKAKSLGGIVAAVTISQDSTIGKLADIVVKLPGSPKEQHESISQSIQPMGSLFEQTMLLFYDALILRYMTQKGLSSSQMYGKHANLE
ncbi:6-phospho-3-hexuloisomerase [Paenibacillus turicensis]|uniref:6-phospho-3-hexuloisomerase n=1 Tax=Paenibacillus turicensis TaxID=160487 RepID=A0ABS4FSH4_9BACL|nr:6-phospho-3-hexuloisomerase [Paenibacillus turicensis]MBP1905541.1 6-phospho-3-hexuloisomerase [Paenibacillus turicensis]